MPYVNGFAVLLMIYRTIQHSHTLCSIDFLLAQKVVPTIRLHRVFKECFSFVPSYETMNVYLVNCHGGVGTDLQMNGVVKIQCLCPRLNVKSLCL
jgi:hypothetical protein